MDNNYCYYTGSGRGRNCPSFNDGTVSFWILDRSVILSLLLTGCVHCTAQHCWNCSPEVCEALSLTLLTKLKTSTHAICQFPFVCDEMCLKILYCIGHLFVRSTMYKNCLSPEIVGLAHSDDQSSLLPHPMPRPLVVQVHPIYGHWMWFIQSRAQVWELATSPTRR